MCATAAETANPAPLDADVHVEAVAEADALARRAAALLRGIAMPTARAAAAVVARSAWTAWDHDREEDFARQVLSRSGRWLRHAALLGRVIEERPKLAAALDGSDGGVPLGGVAALEIARAVRRGSLAGWIAFAREVPLRTLRAALARYRMTGEIPHAPTDARTTSRRPAFAPVAALRAEGPDADALDEAEALFETAGQGEPYELGLNLLRLLQLERTLRLIIGRGLDALGRAGAWPTFGCRDLGEYAERHLALAASTAHDLLATARMSGALPEFADEYDTARIHAQKAVLIARLLRVAASTPSTDDGAVADESASTGPGPLATAWADHAGVVNVKRLRQQVRHAIDVPSSGRFPPEA